MKSTIVPSSFFVVVVVEKQLVNYYLILTRKTKREGNSLGFFLFTFQLNFICGIVALCDSCWGLSNPFYDLPRLLRMNAHVMCFIQAPGAIYMANHFIIISVLFFILSGIRSRQCFFVSIVRVTEKIKVITYVGGSSPPPPPQPQPPQNKTFDHIIVMDNNNNWQKKFLTRKMIIIVVIIIINDE